MALSKNTTISLNYYLASGNETYSELGFPLSVSREKAIENSYVQITSIVGDKNCIHMDVTTYVDSSKMAIISTEKYNFTPNLEGDNFIKQGYEYLKTLQKYVNAIDILEDGQLL